MSAPTPPHIPVMLNEVVEALQPRDGGYYVDGTFGAGGYSSAILDEANCHVHAFDQDPAAIQDGQALVERYHPRLVLHHAPFGQMDQVLSAAGIEAVDGIALDIGVSSMQLDTPERGFSFQSDGPLDMRMSQSGQSAADFVNTASQKALAGVLRTFGEERQAGRIAKAIVNTRADQPLTRTGDLARLVEQVLGSGKRHKIHPATRTFQAIRIYINNELGELVKALRAAERLLKPAGRLVVVAFHSLEDRIVKRFLATHSQAQSRPSRHAPMSEAASPQPSFRLVFKKARTPNASDANPRARSARLRVAERTTALPMPFDVKGLGLPQGVDL